MPRKRAATTSRAPDSSIDKTSSVNKTSAIDKTGHDDYEPSKTGHNTRKRAAPASPKPAPATISQPVKRAKKSPIYMQRDGQRFENGITFIGTPAMLAACKKPTFKAQMNTVSKTQTSKTQMQTAATTQPASKTQTISKAQPKPAGPAAARAARVLRNSLDTRAALAAEGYKAQLPVGYQPEGVTKFQCPVTECDISYSRKGTLLAHIDSRHFDQILYDNGDGSFTAVGRKAWALEQEGGGAMGQVLHTQELAPFDDGLSDADAEHEVVSDDEAEYEGVPDYEQVNTGEAGFHNPYDPEYFSNLPYESFDM